MRNKIPANISLKFSQSGIRLGFLALKELDHKNESSLQQLDKKWLIHNAELIFLHNTVYYHIKMVLFISQLSSETLQQTGLWGQLPDYVGLPERKASTDFSSEVQSQLPFP